MGVNKQSLLNMANALPVRMLLVFVVCALLAMLVADMAYPSFTQDTYKSVATQLAAEAKSGVPLRQQLLQDIQKYNLAWYFVTTADGHPQKRTEAYNPQFKGVVPNISREVELRHKKYYEAVAPIGDDDYLHVGFYKGPVVFSELFDGITAPWPFITIFLVLALTAVFVAIVTYACVTLPLNAMRRALIEALPPGTNLERYDDEFDFLIAPAEIKDLSRVLSAVKANGVMRNDAGAGDDGLKDSIFSPAAISGGTAAVPGFAGGGGNGDRAALSGGRHHYEELSETQSRITETYTKEAEDEFVGKLCRELDTLRSPHQVCQRLLDKLNDKFPTSIIYGAIFRHESLGRFSLEAFLGLDERNLQNLKRIDHSRIAKDLFAGGQPLILQGQPLKDYGLGTLASVGQLKTAIYLPMHFQGRQLAMLAVYFGSEGQTVQDRLRVLKCLSEAAARPLLQATVYEEQLESARTDPLTGLRNKIFLGEVMPTIFTRASIDPERNPVSIIVLDGDNFKRINEVHGQVVGDQVLQELAATLRSCVRTTDGDTKTAGDYLIRYGGEEFLLVMENTDRKRALDVAERIRWAVENKADWPGGVGNWTVSVGIGTYPQDGKTGEDLISKAETALSYAKEELGRNKVCHSQDVPKTFKASRQTANIEGELGVFDGAALLQSLATAQKTGILTVTAPDSKQLWMLLQGGKPIQARLGKFYGANAIIEFVTTFKEGNFNFQDVNARDTITKLPRLDEAYDVKKGLERCLMDGALAQDNYNAARSVIPTAELIVRPVSSTEFSARWSALSQLKDPPSKEEFNTMSEIVQRADGTATLGGIFKSLDHVPTATLWRSAALLIQHGLMQTKPAVPV